MKGKTRTREHKDLQNGQCGVIVEEAKWNRADLVTFQIPKRKKVGMRRMKRKTRTREHKDLQNGQQSVQFEEAGWNCADLVKLQIPKRKMLE
jgi:hypothetical protein